FDASASTQSTPLVVLPVGADSYAEWRPDAQTLATGSIKELKYVLRAYDADDRFDETIERPLWVHAETTAGQRYASTSGKVGSVAAAQAESVPASLSSYGNNALAMQGIPINGGTVRVQGGALSPDHQVFVAGAPTPVDAHGSFVSEAIVPPGL